ncbi:phage head closure protein [Aromatoleum aromaticum]|uniref:Phage related protein (Head-tail adaptor) n=1 Tax=Aromatoleum aromaticum (strain DSM 19018 / LMG 30748 / EbN1) TaxID=76114 RepID=Q5P0B9_AROAE|nr:phage head closure protein [Aromatoleum aromaticum]NMG56725.1 phage head closure protein [Aromatoleum aromaticum]CAI09245.1 phage related protein (head-tail adaptor) [Aromatoleum aromaticum EbN1]
MGLNAGRLRHRVTIQAPTRTQDPETGAMTTTWTALATVAAAIEPLSVKDYIAAQTLKSKVAVRIVIRYRADLKHDMRLIGPDGTLYIPQGFLPDPNSGKEWLTIPCSVEA